MSDTLWSSHIDTSLCSASWDRLSGVQEQWSLLFRLLSELRGQSRIWGSFVGTLRVFHGSRKADQAEELHVTSDISALRAQIEAYPDLPEPVELLLSCEPLLWLADDHVNIIDFDSDELLSLGRPVLSSVPDEPTSDGLRPWRLRSAPVDLLTLTISFTPVPFANELGIEVSSRCDLWRPTRLDGEPNLPHGQINAALLADAIERMAVAAGVQPPGRLRCDSLQ